MGVLVLCPVPLCEGMARDLGYRSDSVAIRNYFEKGLACTSLL